MKRAPREKPIVGVFHDPRISEEKIWGAPAVAHNIRSWIFWISCDACKFEFKREAMIEVRWRGMKGLGSCEKPYPYGARVVRRYCLECSKSYGGALKMFLESTEVRREMEERIKNIEYTPTEFYP